MIHSAGRPEGGGDSFPERDLCKDDIQVVNPDKIDKEKPIGDSCGNSASTKGKKE